MSAVIRFDRAMPGLEGLHDYVMEDVPGRAGLRKITAEGGVRLFLIEAGEIAGYAPALRPEHLREVGAATESVTRLHVIVKVVDGVASVNLLAPLLIHAETGRATQLVLDGSQWGVCVPLTAAA